MKMNYCYNLFLLHVYLIPRIWTFNDSRSLRVWMSWHLPGKNICSSHTKKDTRGLHWDSTASHKSHSKAILEPQLQWSFLPVKHCLLDNQGKPLLLYVNFLHMNVNDSLCNYRGPLQDYRAKPVQEYHLPLEH